MLWLQSVLNGLIDYQICAMIFSVLYNFISFFLGVFIDE